MCVRVRARKSRSAFPFQFATAGVELTHLPVCIWNRLKLRVACDCVCAHCCECVAADEGQNKSVFVCGSVCVLMQWIRARRNDRERGERERAAERGAERVSEGERAGALPNGFSCCPGPSL